MPGPDAKVGVDHSEVAQRSHDGLARGKPRALKATSTKDLPVAKQAQRTTPARDEPVAKQAQRYSHDGLACGEASTMLLPRGISLLSIMNMLIRTSSIH